MEGFLAYQGLISTFRKIYLRYEGLHSEDTTCFSAHSDRHSAIMNGLYSRGQPLVTQIDVPGR